MKREVTPQALPKDLVELIEAGHILHPALFREGARRQLLPSVVRRERA